MYLIQRYWTYFQLWLLILSHVWLYNVSQCFTAMSAWWYGKEVGLLVILMHPLPFFAAAYLGFVCLSIPFRGCNWRILEFRNNFVWRSRDPEIIFSFRYNWLACTFLKCHLRLLTNLLWKPKNPWFHPLIPFPFPSFFVSFIYGSRFVNPLDYFSCTQECACAKR